MIGQVTKIQYKKSKPKRSYGFIHGADGEEYWFSLNGIEGISVGDEVSYKGERNEKGFIARDVSIVAESNVHV